MLTTKKKKIQGSLCLNLHISKNKYKVFQNFKCYFGIFLKYLQITLMKEFYSDLKIVIKISLFIGGSI